MTLTFVQDGKVINTLNSTGSDVASGGVIVLENGIRIAVVDIANGESGAAYAEGVHVLTKLTSDAWVDGARVYWDDTNDRLTDTPADNMLAGAAVGAATNSDTTANVKINVGVGSNLSGAHAAGQALVLGTFGSPSEYTANEMIELHGRQTSGTDQKPMMRVRNSAPASVDMTTGAVVTAQFQAYGTDTSDVAGLEAMEAHVGIKAACEIIADLGAMPNMRAGWFKIEDLGFDLTLTGDAAVLCLGWQFNAGTTLTGNADWIFLAKEGSLTDPADAFLRVYDGAGGGWATNLLDIPASLPYDAANSSGTQSGKIACNIGGSTKYIQVYSD